MYCGNHIIQFGCHVKKGYEYTVWNVSILLFFKMTPTFLETQ